MNNIKLDKKDNKPEKKEEVKIVKSLVCKVEEGSIIVKIKDCRMRVYGKNLKASLGQEVLIKYVGDLDDMSTVKLIELVD